MNVFTNISKSNFAGQSLKERADYLDDIFNEEIISLSKPAYESLKPDLITTFEANLERLGKSYLNEDFKLAEQLEIERNIRQGTFSAITSVVGDDENTTTNSIVYAIGLINCAEIINKLKVSWKDTGISRFLSNYAEGWFLTPPCVGASFESVNKFHKGSGIGFTLDPIKFKLLNPVRKQGPKDDIPDMASKYLHLSAIAAWVDPDWVTYDFHQAALVIGTAIFDFHQSTLYPYLYPTEGGSGGLPPYGNIGTAYCGVYHFRKGKAKSAISGIMQETRLIMNGHMKPKDSFFLRSAHLALSGDKEWLKIQSAHMNLKEKGQLSSSEIRTLIRGVNGSDLPPEIQLLGVDIEPSSFLVGSALSFLRKEDLIVTETDLRIQIAKKAKLNALYGPVPLATIYEVENENLKKFKQSHLIVLDQLYNSPEIYEQLRENYLIPGTFEEFSLLAKAYYHLRSEQEEFFSTFFYTDSVKVFKKSEVREYFDDRDEHLIRDFGYRMNKNQLIYSHYDEFESNKSVSRRAEEWLASGDLRVLLEGNIPPGIGTDDSRLIHKIFNLIPEGTCCARVIFLYTNDYALKRTAAIMLQSKHWNKDEFVILIRLSIADYLKICLESYIEVQYSHTALSGPDFYNFIEKRVLKLPKNFYNAVIRMIPITARKNVLFHSFYDIPNIARSLPNFQIRQQKIIIRDGGFLQRSTVQNIQKEQWKETPMEDLWDFADFDLSRSREYSSFHQRGEIRDSYVLNQGIHMGEREHIISWIRTIY
jgi:hypothetical protein